MKVIITGGSGLLGRYLMKTAPGDVILYPTYFTHKTLGPRFGVIPKYLDISDREEIHEVFEAVNPDVVIHCAGIGSVDFAEKSPDFTYAVNVTGTDYLLEAAAKHQAKFIYISSNAVYAGDNPPYSEDSPLSPVNVYGKQKKEAELNVTTYNHHLIIRPYMLYGWPPKHGRGNWVSKILDHYVSDIDKPLYMVMDTIWSPTYAGDCAKAIWRLNAYTGETFNVSSPDQMNLYEFGQKVCEIWELDPKKLIPVKSDHFEGIAPRPTNTGYDLRKLDEKHIRLSGVMEGLQKMKDEGENEL